MLLSSVAALSATLLFVGGEVVIRHREWRRETVPGTLPLIFYRHSRFPRGLMRGAEYFGWVNINRHGFRGPEVNVAREPGTVRIMAVGASTTFDVCAGRDPDTWPARLEHWLNVSDPTRKFEVINAGVPGYRVLDNILRLQSELYRFAPDAIILYAAHNDLARSLDLASLGGRHPSRTPDAMPAVTPWANWLARNSLLYNKVMLRLRALTSRRRDVRRKETNRLRSEKWDQALNRAAMDFKRDVRSFVLIAQSMGITVLLPGVVQISGTETREQIDPSTLAVWRRSTIPAPPEVVLEGYRRFNAVHRAVADSLGAMFIPTGAFGLTGPELYCPGGDPIHFNGLGADRMGRSLADALLGLDELQEVGRVSTTVGADP